MADQALSPLRILDLTHYVAGPFCTKLMAGFGAEVIKIERSKTGDNLRSIGPFYDDDPGMERSIPFLWLNTGKKSITLNLKTETGKEIFEELVRVADIVIENFSPGVMERLGIGYEALREIKPDIIMTSISNFGQTGPYRDYKATEMVEYAMSGLMYITGKPDQPPLTAGPSITQYTAGQTAYLASLVALFKRGVTGNGEHIDISIQESAIENGELALTNHLNRGDMPKRTPDHPFSPWQTYPCKDGYAIVIGAPMRRWHRVAKVVGEPKLTRRIFNRMGQRTRGRKKIEKLIAPWLETNSGRDIYHNGQAEGLAFGYVASLAEALQSPQHQTRGFFEEIEHPIVGKYQYSGAPFRPSETPWLSERAPLLGEHNEAVYSGIMDYSKENLNSLVDGGII